MKNENDWAKPNDFMLTFRCTSTEYADLFLKSGSIKFNTPESWVNYSIEKGEGRGDMLEGTFAMFNFLDIERIKELNNKYKSYNTIVSIPLGEKVYLKNKRSMELPCYCLYILKNSMFECPNTVGLHKLVTDVHKSYFRDFMDNLSPEEIETMDDKDKPALITINNFNEFKNRLMKFLLSIGLEESEIIISRVTYYDFEQYGKTGWFDLGDKFPNELTIKNKRFANQNEARIIINTDKKYLKEFLMNNPINIGSMEDIATICKGYMYDGLRIEMDADIISKEEII